jgi:hypothetical protein
VIYRGGTHTLQRAHSNAAFGRERHRLKGELVSEPNPRLRFLIVKSKPNRREIPRRSAPREIPCVAPLGTPILTGSAATRDDNVNQKKQRRKQQAKETTAELQQNSNKE